MQGLTTGVKPARFSHTPNRPTPELSHLTQGLTTHTEIGAAVRRLALADVNVAKAKLELFLPGRTTFVFDLDDDFGDDLPTQVRLLPASVVFHV